jgi:hypothetical protein
VWSTDLCVGLWHAQASRRLIAPQQPEAEYTHVKLDGRWQVGHPHHHAVDHSQLLLIVVEAGDIKKRKPNLVVTVAANWLGNKGQ